MKIPVGNHISAFAGALQTRPARTASPAAKTQKSTARRFDQITISGSDAERNSFAAQLKERITQDARVATTTGTLITLRNEIEAGTYEPDPSAIARKMLFLGEV